MLFVHSRAYQHLEASETTSLSFYAAAEPPAGVFRDGMLGPTPTISDTVGLERKSKKSQVYQVYVECWRHWPR